MKIYLKAGIKATLSLLGIIIMIFGIIIGVDLLSKLTIYNFPIVAAIIEIVFFGCIWLAFFNEFKNKK